MIAALSGIWPLLFLLCPLAMGLMMWWMVRARMWPSADPSEPPESNTQSRVE